MCFQGTYCKITALEEGTDGVKKKKSFESAADEITEKRKFTPLKKNTRPLPRALARSQLFALVCSWTWSKCGRILARDVTLCFFWQLTQQPQAMVNTDLGGGVLGQVQRTNRLVRPDSKTVQIWMCGSKEQEGVSGIKLDFYCVTRENICKLLTGPRHQGKTNLQAVWDFRTLTMLTHTNIKYSIRT